MIKFHNMLLALFCFAMVLLGIALGAHAFKNESPRIFSLPSDLISFQPGPGSQIATTYCLICHSAEYVYMQPPHSREKWKEIVHKMKHTFGCPIPESDIPDLATYLVSQNEIQPMAALQKTAKKSASHGLQPVPTSSGNSGRGKRIFGTYCVNCHGSSGHGDGPIGKALVPPAADLTVIGKKSDKELLKTIRNGRPGTAMPAWKHDLSPQEILDVLAYIRTLAS